MNATRHCNLCHTDLTHSEWVDGKTIFGPWAVMCLDCHKAKGLGLGVGLGQRFAPDGKKLEG